MDIAATGRFRKCSTNFAARNSTFGAQLSVALGILFALMRAKLLKAAVLDETLVPCGRIPVRVAER
jgi:hypothetical protein